jgi:hypothetical protein
MMEGFIINIIATAGFSGIFLMVFFSIYYLYLKGNVGDIRKKVRLKIRIKD